MNSRAQILSRLPDIPAIPAVATRAIHLLNDANSDIDDVVSAVRNDPALTANLLRMCNSAAFGAHREFDSVRDAIIRLGSTRVLKLIMNTAMQAAIGRPVRGYDLPAGELWRRSVAVAMGVEELATELKLPQDPAAYTGALLLDIGKIVLGSFLEVDAQPIIREAYSGHLSFEAAERNILGIDHAEIGAKLLELWNFPASIVEIVRWHHEPGGARADTRNVDLVHTADLLIMEAGIGLGIDGINYAIGPEVSERLNLTAATIERTLCSVVARFSEIEALLVPATEGV